MRTRIAPSPSGELHIGTLRTALLNYLMSKANGGDFILRIDDTNLEESSEENVNHIIESLKRYGLIPDLIFRQSDTDRVKRYTEVAKDIGTKSDDGTISIPISEGYDMVLIKSNGYPTYNFASAVDDYDYNITHIIRGVDHIANEDRQRELWSKMPNNKTFPTIIYAGLLLENGKKLSKSEGNGKLSNYTSYKPLALLNWLFRLGWSHSDPEFDKTYKYMTLDDMINVFNSGKINNKNCSVDINKLKWFDRKIK